MQRKIHMRYHTFRLIKKTTKKDSRKLRLGGMIKALTAHQILIPVNISPVLKELTTICQDKD